MNEEIIDKIKFIISTLLNVPKDIVNNESSPHTIKKWDSINHLKIILSLEEFNLKFLRKIESMVSVGL